MTLVVSRCSHRLPVCHSLSIKAASSFVSRHTDVREIGELTASKLILKPRSCFKIRCYSNTWMFCRNTRCDGWSIGLHSHNITAACTRPYLRQLQFRQFRSSYHKKKERWTRRSLEGYRDGITNAAATASCSMSTESSVKNLKVLFTNFLNKNTLHLPQLQSAAVMSGIFRG